MTSKTVLINDNNQWKIASSSNRSNVYADHTSRESPYTLEPTHASLPPSLGRSQSPFSKIERYRPKSAMIDPNNQARKAQRWLGEKEQLEELIERDETFLPMKPTTDDAIEKPAISTTIKPVLKNTNQHTWQYDYVPWTWWSTYAFILTCCIPNWLLSTVGKKKTKLIQQAWREKIALCSVIILLCAGLGFFTFGMRFAICPHERVTNTYTFHNTTTGKTSLTWRSDVTVYGRLYPLDIMNSFLQGRYNISLSKDFEGTDMSPLFDADPNNVCGLYMASIATCNIMNPYTTEPTAAIELPCIPIHELTNYYSTDNYLEFTWHDLKLNLQRQYNTAENRTETVFSEQPHLMVLSDTVIDIRPYLLLNQPIFGDKVDLLLRQNAGQDASYTFSTWNDAKSAWPCLVTKYAAGVISSDTMGCVAYEIVTDFLLAMVVTLMLTRFLMALLFHWWVSRRLTKPGGRSRGILAWRSVAGGNQFPKKHRPSISSSLDTLVAVPTLQKGQSDAFENDPRHTILFVTCYSEGEESIKGTLDSLVETTYSNQHKLLFIVTDGIITGSGNSRPTSEICRRLLVLTDCEEDEEEPACEYEAIADGPRRINRARVYIGHYRSTPALLVIKCGTEQEVDHHKPGNRGKRDSQMILMSFFQKVIFYDLFSPLDYEIFWKMRKLMKQGLTPDKFELVLMVDADTRVDPDSLSHMVAAMNNDITLMGLCGETKVANKGASWVTAIQVFEYYISHHYAKAFESVFGGVTCLPGCFSMYRIKAPKNGGWIPILANPDIIREFNVTTVNTLHAKNLLLLGEDRFLSTLMLRTFPRRQMVFVPQAKCRTIVPDTFHVLLSQRRRWINSTVHNLMELSLVSDLCGIACLSMQFVVVIDLISSIVLPAAVILLVCFFINIGFTDSPQYQPLFILLVTLGLPAILVLLTAKKLSYIGWMSIYVLALPIWNFVLPVYSFWHFDDFTWGETRKIHGIDNLIAENEERRSAKLPSTPLMVEKRLWHSWEQERLEMPLKRIAKTKRIIIPTRSTITQPASDTRSTTTFISTSVSPTYPATLSPQSMHQPMFYYPNHNQYINGQGFYSSNPIQTPINQFMSPLPFIPQQPLPSTTNVPYYLLDRRYPDRRHLRQFL